MKAVETAYTDLLFILGSELYYSGRIDLEAEISNSLQNY